MGLSDSGAADAASSIIAGENKMVETSGRRESGRESHKEPHGPKLENFHPQEGPHNERIPGMGDDASARLREELNKRPDLRLEMGKPSRHNENEEVRGISTLPKCNIFGEESNRRCESSPAENDKSNEKRLANPTLGDARVDTRDPYVEGMGITDVLHDPRLKKSDIGTAIVSADKSGDNFQLNKAVLDLPKTDIRYQFEKAQSIINGDLGHTSIHIGVDPKNLHVHYRKVDLTLPYDEKNDLKNAPDVNDAKVRKELVDRVSAGQNEAWQEDVRHLSTPQLALFDAISRSDGPALRSAMSLFKDAEKLDENFQAISEFANSPAHGVSNWGNIIWSNDLKSLTVYNGVPIFSGKFPFDQQ